MSATIQDIPLKKIDGSDATLGQYQGKALLVVNVASKCGLTPQYEALEKVHERFADKDFAVLGFPANDFGAQEPGTNTEIQQFCTTNYGVKFPMFAKIAVTGEQQHPLYRELTKAQPQAYAAPGSNFRKKLADYGLPPPKNDNDVLWNFEKFLIGKNGAVVARFAPDLPPDDPAVIGAIEKELAKH